MPQVKLTPTEYLVLDVLIARYRLGEHLWTFPSNVSRAIDSLAAKGLCHSMNGVTDHTVRAILTDAAVAEYISHKYVPPIARDDAKLAKKFKQITKDAKKLKKASAAPAVSD